jgi:hypothetical protein
MPRELVVVPVSAPLEFGRERIVHSLQTLSKKHEGRLARVQNFVNRRSDVFRSFSDWS